MRPTEILFVTLSVLIIGLVGFAPLFPAEAPERRIKHECRLFYGPSGDAAVEACLNQMGYYTVSGAPTPPCSGWKLMADWLQVLEGQRWIVIPVICQLLSKVTVVSRF